MAHVPPVAQPACSAEYQEVITTAVSVPIQNRYHVAPGAYCQLKTTVEPVTSPSGASKVAAGGAAYAAAKAGLNALVGTLARELLASGATANAVMPSTVDTEANRREMPNADHASWVQPEEVAALLAFLASERASATSGALIPIYGRA